MTVCRTMQLYLGIREAACPPSRQAVVRFRVNVLGPQQVAGDVTPPSDLAVWEEKECQS